MGHRSVILYPYIVKRVLNNIANMYILLNFITIIDIIIINVNIIILIIIIIKNCPHKLEGQARNFQN